MTVISRGSLLRATWKGDPAVSNPDGTAERMFRCKEYPRLSAIKNTGPEFFEKTVFAVDGKKYEDLAEVIAKLNEREAPKPGQPINISARIRWRA